MKFFHKKEIEREQRLYNKCNNEWYFQITFHPNSDINETKSVEFVSLREAEFWYKDICNIFGAKLYDRVGTRIFTDWMPYFGLCELHNELNLYKHNVLWMRDKEYKLLTAR